MRTLNASLRLALLVTAALLVAAPAPAQVVTVIHSFTNYPTDGSQPGGSLVQSGSTFYGMTSSGGTANLGTVFQMGASGLPYNVLHSFTAAPTDGASPTDAPLLVGSTLYGLASGGGAGNSGVVFKMNTDGSGFTVVHSFAGGSAGVGPVGSLIQVGSALYGMTYQGGTANKGTVFKINPDGSGFAILHSFSGGAADGDSPSRSLVANGSTLYGTTANGGPANFGTVFSIGADGSNFAVLHAFAGAADGANPAGTLTVVGSTLYGTAVNSGPAGHGTAFKLNPDGTGLTVLHAFADGAGDGGHPYGALTLAGSTLYGTALDGGTDALGILFGMNVDGSGFTVQHSFAGALGDGAEPEGDLLLSGSTFYGTTYIGGSINQGTVFSFTPVPEPSTLLLTSAGGAAAWLLRRRVAGAARRSSGRPPTAS
jgi:uncharacterized repeat protein (TIGR03803 family)